VSDSTLKRTRLLSAWAAFACTRPLLTLVICFTLAAVGIAITLTQLEFKSDRSALVDPSLPWQQRYAEFKDKFPRWNDVVVVVDLDSVPDAALREAFFTALESKLQGNPSIASVTAGFPRAEAPAGLIYTQPIERVRESVEQLKQTAPVLLSPTLPNLLGLSELGGVSLRVPQREGLTGLLQRAADLGESRRTDVLGLDGMRATERLITPSGKLATVLVSINTNHAAANSEEAVNTPAHGIAAVREVLNELRNDTRFAGIQTGVTGVPVLESDETSQSMRDASRASAISLALITILMLIVYRGFAIPIIAVIALLVGMAWSFAWATLSIGHLQVLSITFASLLMGLGIDVAIHIIARLELVHPDHDHMTPAIVQAYRGVGPGIITASITVAAAAASMALTGFSGVGELGIIAAGGMILCTISIMSCLPAMLVLLPKPEKRLRTRDGGESKPFMGRFGVLLDRWAVRLVGVCAVLLIGAGFLASGVRYDTDLQKLMPEGVESVVWSNRLEADDARSVWHAVVLAKDEAEAHSLTTKLAALPEVSKVDAIGMLYTSPEHNQQVKSLLTTLPTPPADTTTDHGKPADLRRAAQSIADRWKGKDDTLSFQAQRVAALNDTQLDRILAAYRVDRVALQQQVASLRSAEPVPAEALPTALKQLMVGTDNSLLLRVYPHSAPQGQSVLAPKPLNQFANAVLSVAPQATGPTIQIFESTRLINEAYLRAGIYAFATIFILLLIDFGLTLRGLGDTLTSLLPVAAGAILMLAWMRVFDVALNFANMIVMPLIIGIGVGAGVHAVRRWRLQPLDAPLGLAGGSGRAIGLTILTTVFGFAAMMSAEHRGVRSLGFVMSVGLMMVWASTVFLLPGVLRLRSRRQPPPVEPATMEHKHLYQRQEVGAA